MKHLLPLFAIFILTLPPCATAQENLPLKVEGAWMRAIPESSEETAVYMTLTHTGTKPLRLLGGSMEIASMVMPMITTKKTVAGREVFGMGAVPSFEIPVGGKLVLEPGGNHLMIMGLKKHPHPGDRVKLVLKFDPGQKELRIELPVSLEPVKQ